MDRPALLDMLTAGVTDLDRPAGPSDIAAIMARPLRRASRTAADRRAAAQQRTIPRLIAASSISDASSRILRRIAAAMRGDASLSCPDMGHSLYAECREHPRGY